MYGSSAIIMKSFLFRNTTFYCTLSKYVFLLQMFKQHILFFLIWLRGESETYLFLTSQTPGIIKKVRRPLNQIMNTPATKIYLHNPDLITKSWCVDVYLLLHQRIDQEGVQSNTVQWTVPKIKFKIKRNRLYRFISIEQKLRQSV